MEQELIFEGSGVAIKGRALLIEGQPGVGKSSLALALIDRGAVLIGDDAVRLSRSSATPLLAHPPPNIDGLLEIRGVGIAKVESSGDIPVSLILCLASEVRMAGPRLPESLEERDMLGVQIPVLPFIAGPTAPAQRAEWALKMHGI
ncbi:HPr kinase/phosphorylase [Erythrobacter sp. YT30]|uniref:HPr kinase/phosphorylase n=1 Tax=Erythrobacter sp. YT30 TaxID=1735012 RepID=UPI00076D3B47|nr:hypothetical protein [Erythrobacter sp. YT30]KWV90467.1 hypothetical protein AUC45_14590 [Erythrobacter sp. YT30]